MPSRPAVLTPGQPATIHIKPDTVDGLLKYRRDGERPNDIIARLIRFAQRYAPVAEVGMREEFLP